MTASQRQKNLPWKNVSALLLAGIIAALAGGRVAPVVTPALRCCVGDEVVLFGQTLSQGDLGVILAYTASFLALLAVLLFSFRDRRGKRGKSAAWGWAIGFILTASFVAFFYVNKIKIGGTPLTSQKQETGYKAADRDKLEQLIHEGAKDD